jgi:hypothetical protein
MPTPSSGPISFLNLQTTFSPPSPVSFSQLYRGGTYVPNISPDSNIPTSGEIAIDDFYGTWGRKTLTFTMTVGSGTGSKGSKKDKKGTLYGFGSSFGSISNNTFLTPSGVMTITGLYYSVANSNWHLQLSKVGAAPADADLSFLQMSVGNYTTVNRSARTNTAVSGTARRWDWYTANTSHPISGTVACSIQYYG